MSKEDKYRTHGFGGLSASEKREIKRLLKKAGVELREVGEKDQGEIVLFKLTASGLFTQVAKLLAGVGVDLLDPYE